MQMDLENLTKKWWFYVTFFLVVIFIQPVVNPIDFAEMGAVLREALVPYGWLAPLFHIATIIFAILRARRANLEAETFNACHAKTVFESGFPD